MLHISPVRCRRFVTELRRSARRIAGMDFETRAIHEGQEPDPATGAITTPIYQTSTYVQEAVGVHKGYDYSRVANPTRSALQECLASLESAEHGIAFSSGLGAVTTLMHLVDPGQRVVLIADVYGGVYRMTSQVYEPKGYIFDYVPRGRVPEPARASRRQHAHRLDRVAVEPDAERRRHPRRRRRGARGRRAARRRQHVRDAVSPAPAGARRRHRRPLDDEVPRRPLRRRRRFRRDERPDDRGAPLLPAEVARRGTRPVRLVARPARRSRRSRCACGSTARTRWPSRSRSTTIRASSTSSTPACRRTRATRSRRARCTTSAAWSRSSRRRRRRPRRSSTRTKLFQLAESLGGVESMIEVPARMTHASTAAAPFAAPPNLVRLSVGIESAADLTRRSRDRARSAPPRTRERRDRRSRLRRDPDGVPQQVRVGRRARRHRARPPPLHVDDAIPPTTASSRARSPRTATRSTRSSSSPSRRFPAAGSACA